MEHADEMRAIPEDALVLNALADCGGAILYWQMSPRDSALFEGAALRGIITFDPEGDLYVHPLAVKQGCGAYTLDTDDDGAADRSEDRLRLMENGF